MHLNRGVKMPENKYKDVCDELDEIVDYLSAQGLYRLKAAALHARLALWTHGQPSHSAASLPENKEKP